MRYTRYDINNKNKVNFSVWIVLIIVLGTLIGIGIYKILIGSNLLNIGSNNNMNNNPSSKEFNVSIIQCGVYKSKENADMQIKVLENDSVPFIIQDEDKYKVMYGIYEEQTAIEKQEAVKSKNISSFIIKCHIDDNTDEQILKIELIQGFIQIIQKFQEDSEVKAVNTDKFKEWSENTLKEYEGSDDEINTIKSRIEVLPPKYTKENAAEDSKMIYDILINYKCN